MRGVSLFRWSWRAIVLNCLLLAAAPDCFAQDMPLHDVLLENTDWELVGAGYKFTEAPAVDAQGNLYFSDVPAGDIYKVGADGVVTAFVSAGPRVSGLMFGPQGQLFGCHIQDRRIVVYDPSGKFKVVANDLGCNDLVVTREGNIYCTDTGKKRVWLVRPNGEKQIVDTGIERPNGVILWNDQQTLVVSDSAGRYLWTFSIAADGTLHNKQPYYTLRLANGASASAADGMTVDSLGRLYCATQVGVQVFDPTGRASGVIRKPQAKFLSNVVLGGPKFDTLFATVADKVYRRTTQATARPYFLPPGK